MRGKTYSSQSQQLILNLYEFFTLEKLNKSPFIPVTAVNDRVCTALKISPSSLTRIVRRTKQNPDGRPVTPPMNNRSRVGKGKVQSIDAEKKEAIKKVLEEYVEQKISITLDKMHTLLKEKELFPYSRTSLRKLIQHLGYQFKTKNKKSFLYKRIPNEVVWLKEEDIDTDSE